MWAAVARRKEQSSTDWRVSGSTPCSPGLHVVCPWARHFTHLACWWWSEGPVAPVRGSLASVRVPQGSCGYCLVARHHQCVNVCVNG